MIQHWPFGPVPLAGKDGHARQAGLTAIMMVSTGERGGNLADMLQYGAVYGMIFGILGLFGTIITHRMLV